jgi:uncharacterized membrane protein YphA (DoxX/SURF4 family)
MISKSLAFRFCVLYFALYAAATQILGGVLLLPGLQLPALGTVWPLRNITLWLAEHVFGLTPPLLYTGNSGDTAFHWVQLALLLTIAIVATAIWSAWDRGRHDYPALRKWFRVFLRFALASQMFYYGMAKIIPTQFPPPNLVTLIEPVGSASLSDLLWTFIGSSTPYQIFTGCAEMLAGVLLVIPKTTTLGALIGVLDMTQVFLLNMTYDFGLKQISFHLLGMFAFLLAPEFTRLLNVLVLNRPTEPSTERPLFATARANRLALGAQVIAGLYLIAMFTSLATRSYYNEGGPGAARSPFYGIWNVEQLAIDGEVRPVALNDYDRRWRRVIFDTPTVVVFQRTDDSLAHYGASFVGDSRTIALTKRNSRTWSAQFSVERPAPDRLILNGEMDHLKIQMQLRRVELDTFRLLRSTFRWVRPPDPFAG